MTSRTVRRTYSRERTYSRALIRISPTPRCSSRTGSRIRPRTRTRTSLTVRTSVMRCNIAFTIICHSFVSFIMKFEIIWVKLTKPRGSTRTHTLSWPTWNSTRLRLPWRFSLISWSLDFTTIFISWSSRVRSSYVANPRPMTLALTFDDSMDTFLLFHIMALHYIRYMVYLCIFRLYFIFSQGFFNFLVQLSLNLISMFRCPITHCVYFVFLQ